MIEIGEMVIRIPSLEVAEARQLGKDVAQHIATGMPQINENRHIDSVNLQLSIGEELSRDQMARHIAKQLLGQIT